MSGILPNGKQQFIDSNGNPLASGKVYYYIPSTTTFKNTYQDPALTILNTNPIQLDANGQCIAYGDGSYRQQVYDVNNNLIWDQESDAPLSISDLEVAAGATYIGYQEGQSNSVVRTVAQKLQEFVSVLDFGAVTNGTTDNSTFFTNSNIANTTVYIPKGNYAVNSNVTFTNPIVMEYGAILDIANGVTVTFNEGFEAGIYQTFNCSGTGAVVFSSQFLTTGYPEWWGAVSNNGSDCLAAINACIVACPITELQSADYAISSTLNINTNSRTLQGASFNYLGSVTGSATRLIVLSGSLSVIQIGPSTQPSSINNFLTDVTVQNLEVSRSAASVIGSQCAGIIMQFSLYCYIKQVKSVESQIGFHYAGCVSCHTSGCYSFRSSAGSGSGTDQFWGYYVDGISYNIGAAGGNASIYFDENNASCAGSCPTNSSGFYLNGNFTDCYISRAECDGFGYGIAVIGNGLTTQQYGNNDLLITAPVIDAFTLAGILFQNTSKFGSVSVNGGYCAPASGSTEVTGLYFQNSLAQVSVTDFQTIGNSSSTCTGISGVNSANIETKTQIIDVNSSAISLTNVTNSRFLDHVTNYGDTAGAMCELSGACNRNYFQVFATGKSSAFTIGYQGIGSGNTYNELNCTGIDPVCISGGSVNKLTWNGTQITTTGPISSGSTNLASGIMA